MTMPLPRHLREIASIRGGDDCSVGADLACQCGSSTFELRYPGTTQEHGGERIPCPVEIDGAFFFRIEACCAACRRTHLVFDKDFHGWDGFVCHDPEQAALPRPPLTTWHCAGCTATAQRVRLLVQGEGEDDFVENAGDDFPPESWPEGFGWITIDIACAACGHEPEMWVSYETM
jgi:hypothetical protein